MTILRDENGPARNRWWSYLAVGVLSAVLGGLLVAGLFWRTVGGIIPSPNLAPPVSPTAVQGADPVVDIAKNVSPAVVGISSQARVFGFFAGQGNERTGSGVIFDPSAGYIVTNNHVVEGASHFIVTLADGRQISGDLVGRDPRTDLAVLRIKADNLTGATFGDSDQVNVGELAVAIGNPMGMKFARSVTAGVISGLNRPLTTDEGYAFRLIQTDAAINPGNSGGALVNARGEVIGINTIKVTLPGFEGMGFAIPSNQVKKIINDLIQYGKVIRPGLGVIMQGEITPEVADYYDLSVDYGVLVRVVPGGPAQKAGLLNDDVIIAINDRVVKTASDLQDALLDYGIGDEVQVKVDRRIKTDKKTTDKQLVFKVKLAELTEAR
ncbi:MAG: PDZ domain-containing protein [Firmicutes bacterium]|nr:PDZ domain-containing protein [Bacillota bacterium]